MHSAKSRHTTNQKPFLVIGAILDHSPLMYEDTAVKEPSDMLILRVLGHLELRAYGRFPVFMGTLLAAIVFFLIVKP